MAVRGGAMRVAGYLFGVALSVGSAALLFRHLGVEDGGRYVTVTSLVALFGGLTEAGLASITVRELSAHPAREGAALMQDVVGLRLCLSLAAGAAAIGFAAAVGYPSRVVEGTALAAVGMVVGSVQVTWSAALMARLRFAWVTALDLIRQVVVVLGIVALVAAGSTLVPFLALAIPAALAAAVPTALLIRRQNSLRPHFQRAVWGRLLRDVLPYAAATAVAAVYYRVSLILVSLLSSSQQTGYFGASFRVVEVLVVIPVLAVGAAFPVFARAAGSDRDRFRFAVQQVADASAAFGALVVVLVFVGAPAIIDVVAGSDFRPADGVLRLECLGLLGSFLAAVWGFALLSLGRHRALLWLACGPLVVNAALTAIVAPAHGARGAAIAATIGEACLAIAGGAVARSAMRPQVLRFGGIARAVAAAIPCGALALVDGVPAALLAPLAGSAYVAILWMSGGLRGDVVAGVRMAADQARAARARR
jgi:O-antigen/teichoic acid export membrane protein